jgi:Na+-translocating ferredoxin:NAD+ oxidoreductase RnfE subunit
MLTGNDAFTGLSFADHGLLLLVLPPGAFFSLALAVAAKNAFDRKRRRARNTGQTRSLRRSG